jgi:hypothetical protein
VREALTDASEKSLVDTLGSQLMKQLGSGAVSPDASTYVRIGQLLGLAVAGDDLPSSDAAAIRQSLDGAELMASPQGAARAPVVLVVLGQQVDPAILSGVVEGLADKATGVVVAGSARGLADLRSEPAASKVATVDGVATALGRVTATLALIRSLTVQGGSFGASGSDGAVPVT